MSQPNAAFRFLSWVRRGAATQIQPKDVPSMDPARVTVPIEVAVDGITQPAALSLTLQGPGDVTGFDARAVVRMWPPSDTHDAEPNYFPLVELDQVDLPWRFTPRRRNDAGRLRPWLCLIALKDSDTEIAAYEPPRADRALGKVTIAMGTPMPRLEQAWAWAHVQVSGDDDRPLKDVVTREPERCLARLLCPRRLDARTVYWAMLVPVFMVGRRAGLRQPLDGTALEPAWTVVEEDNGPTPKGTISGPVELPVYYRWRFGTGAGGDFESLVQQLTPRALPATVGTRPIDVTQPGGGLPSAATAPLAIGGALQAPTTAPPPWPAEEKAAFVSALASRLNIPADAFENTGAAVVAPPLYGQWHAKKVRLEPAQNPPWFQHLNEDPRTRVAAALGTAVVQDQQHELMASAWEQVAGIREANDQLRKAQLARAIGERLHVRFVQPTDADGVLTFTGATHGHLRHGLKTVRALAQRSPVNLAPLGSAFRRLVRPLGPTGRRQGRPDQAAAPVVSRINDGSYDKVLTATPPASTSLPTHQWMAKQGVPWKGPPSAGEIKAQPARQNVVVWDPVYGKPPRDDPSPDGEDSPSMARFRDAAIAFAQRQADPAAGETLYRMAMSAIRTTIVSAVDPKLTIPASIGPRLVRTAGFPWNPPDPIEPVMAHPEFPQPMYKPLAALSQDWVLPGLSDIPANTVALAITNPAFIEAYLVGLNHEMARELLWREYPTDQRGSYFRQFWDPAGLAPTPVPETAKDIRRLHEWLTTSDLGTHSPRPVPPSPDGRHLVLLVRGEVLRRYPGTLVYAQRAEGTIGHRILATPTEQRQPVFAGRLRPDVAFFGFELTVEQARGGTTDPGWFFVFEEQPGEPRFGLDVSAEGAPASWDQLAWTHLVGSAEELATLGYIDLAATLPNTTTIQQPGGAGWHVDGPGVVARGADHAAITFQRPVRVAVHASEMLP